MPSNPTTTPEQWRQLEALFNATADLTSEDQRAYLEIHCSDPVLRDAVEVLLKHDRMVGRGIQHTIERAAADLFVPSDASGERLGAYRLLLPLQQGGMGTVYCAERADDEFHKRVAIKLLRNICVTEEERRRFRAERQILADLEHPHIARLIDGGTREDGSPYLVMEYVDGLPIDQFCDNGRLSVEERLKLFQQLCFAVEYAHRRRVIHRDLKPANVFVTRDGAPKLLDFGIAKFIEPQLGSQDYPVTRHWERRVTPEYASPEQLSGATVGMASDIYSLGVILYELLCGSRPYMLTGCKQEEIIQTVCHGDIIPPSRRLPDDAAREDALVQRIAAARRTQPGALARRLHGDLDNIVLKALRKEPKARYPSAAQFAEDVGRFLTGDTVLARAPSVVSYALLWMRRHVLGISITATVTMAVMATLIYFTAMAEADRRIQELIANHSSPIDHLPGVAVLPFHELGSSANDELLGTGMTDEIISALSTFGALRVTAYNSVIRYRATDYDVATVARELGMRYVVTGTIVRQDSVLNVHAALTDTQTQIRLLDIKYADKRINDIFTIQSELIHKIVKTLGVRLSVDEQRRIDKRHTYHADAYLAFLQGLSVYGRRSRDDILEARRHFEQAVAIDPKFARAWATLANTYRAEFAGGWSDNPTAALKKAETLVTRALTLDDSIPQIHFVFGLVRREQRRNSEALAASARAIALNPNYADGFLLMATILCYDGRPENTIGLLQKSLALNPHFAVQYPSHAGQCHFAQRRFNDAANAFEQALEKNPVSERELLWLAASYVHAGRLEEAKWKIDEARAQNPSLSLRRIEPTVPFSRQELLQLLLDGLRQAGMPEE